MKALEIITEAPQRGQPLDIEFDDLLIETEIVDITEDGVVVHLDETAMQLILEAKDRRKVVAEGAEFGSKYAEQLAQQVFNHSPNIKDENQVLNLGYNISKSDLGSRAQGIFRDEDFPSDFVSAYFYLQKKGVAEGSQDKTVKIVKRGGKPIGEIGIDPEASSGNGPYYVKLYDGSVDLSGYDTAEEALAELKYLVKQSVAKSSINEGQYEMMMRNGRVKKFIAKDDADAKRIAAGHGAKSVIRLKGGVPAGKVSEQGVAEGFSTDPTGPATWNGHKVVANRKTPKGSFLILQNKNDGKYEIHKQNPGVVGGLEFMSVHKTPEEMQTAFKQLTGIDESNQDVAEAKYQGRTVQLGKRMAGDVKKFKVYVKNKKGNVIKVNFGQKGVKIKKNNPARRKSFRARHNCATAKDRTTPRYWSCRAW